MTNTTKHTTISKPGVLSPSLMMLIVVLMTITGICQAGAQAAKYTIQRPSTAENVSARVIENTSSASVKPNPQAVKERPIQDFLKAQGTPPPPPPNNILFYAGPDAPGLPNYAVGFTTASCPGEFCQYP